ncbi:hypothetical protein [Corynebacterium uterequi]|uniref:Uncharacterized protein n=1 Tax=Corynebacterium uterequi TaxID=1072256 RepID=A0A0G3HCL9_9CORY|nr:hypothetical protein [Corynebacterium uterequi]AKK10455.1 hypothetical protein CUTER_02200 [Corynebacterium uterequi]
MAGTSVRNAGVANLSGLSTADKVNALRSQMQAMVGSAALAPVGPAAASELPQDDGLDVGLPLPLPRRAITEVSDCPALIVHLLDRITRGGGYAAVIGWPELSVAGIERLHQLVLVPDPGPEPLSIAGVLAEGLDVVVWHTAGEIELSPTRARPLAAKARAGQAAVVLVGPKVASPALRVDASVTTYRGIGRGSGRITGLDIEVAVRNKSQRRRAVVTLGERPRLQAVGS